MIQPSPHASGRLGFDDPASTNHGVLVVDDDALVRNTIAMQLESAGLQIATAADIGAAQAALDGDKKITVVVCDIHLAHESGFELAGALADLRPERLATEIVFITGNASSDTAIEALRHRAFDLIRKPVRRAELVARVGQAHQSAARRRHRQTMLDEVDSRLSEGEALKQNLITALHDAEVQHRAFKEDAGAARHNLLAVIGHELKTPLIPIVGFADILLDATDLSPEEVREFASLIRDGGERLRTIIDRTLSYLDAERQHELCGTEAFAIDDLIADTLRDLPERGATPTPEIEVDCPAGLRAEGVRTQLSQALGELIDNAINASQTGDTVLITAGRRADGGVYVAVSDTGPGLPDSVRSNLGVPFLKGDTSLSRNWPGVGIGLARARTIAQLCGGDIDFREKSASGGTCVSLIMRESTH